MLKPGQRIGHITIQTRIGAGGMGEVYRGYDEVLERVVAVKSIHRAHRLSGSARSRFVREARILSQLDHPGICRIYDMVEAPEAECLILEFIEGATLGQAGPTLPSEAARVRVILRVAEALAAAHAEQIVHRDLKPDNVMLTPDGSVKVLDFGIARSAVHADESLPAQPAVTAPGVTRAGQVLGTTQYMSPEQAAGDNVTVASDLYSLGLLLIEIFSTSMLGVTKSNAADTPEPVEVIPEVREAVTATGVDEGWLESVETEPEPLASLVPELSHLRGDLRTLATELLQEDPTRRPTASQVVERLEAWLDRPVRLRRRALWALLTVLVLALLVATAVVSTIVNTEPLLLSPDQEGRIAILPFVNETGDKDLDWVDLGLPSLVVGSLEQATDEVDTVALDLVQDVVKDLGVAKLDETSAAQLIEILDVELLIATVVRHDPQGWSLEYTAFSALGSTSTRAVVDQDLTVGAGILAARLALRLDPQARVVALEDQYSDDPFLNRVYATGVQRLLTTGALSAQPWFEACLDGDPDLGWARFQLATALERQSRWDEAEEAGKLALGRGRASKDVRLEVHSRNHLAYVAYKRGDYDKVKALVDENQSQCRAAGLVEAEAIGRQILGFVALRTLDLDTAEEHLLAFQTLVEGKNRRSTAKAKQQLAIIADYRGESERSMELLEQALATQREIRDSQGVADTLNSLGIVATTLDDLDRAQEWLLEAVRLERESEDREGVANALSNLGNVTMKRGEVEETERLYSEALAINEELGFTQGVALTSYNLAALFSLNGRAEEADSLLKVAEEFWPGDPECMTVRSRILYERGDHAGALALLGQARELMQPNWDPTWQIHLETYERAVAEGRHVEVVLPKP